ncbi:MAG: hypothetical protein EXR21_06085 [Flavobacteriaceae bacterium]|nr:hypothetical protein [Flavobacteriaceae bacterium]
MPSNLCSSAIKITLTISIVVFSWKANSQNTLPEITIHDTDQNDGSKYFLFVSPGLATLSNSCTYIGWAQAQATFIHFFTFYVGLDGFTNIPGSTSKGIMFDGGFRLWFFSKDYQKDREIKTNLEPITMLLPQRMQLGINGGFLKNNQYQQMHDSSKLEYGYLSNSYFFGLSCLVKSFLKYQINEKPVKAFATEDYCRFFADIFFGSNIIVDIPNPHLAPPQFGDMLTYKTLGMRVGLELYNSWNKNWSYYIGLAAGRLPFALYKPDGATYISLKGGLVYRLGG